jgi:hypothetical protein
MGCSASSSTFAIGLPLRCTLGCDDRLLDGCAVGACVGGYCIGVVDGHNDGDSDGCDDGRPLG